jgi:hypothetical protein
MTIRFLGKTRGPNDGTRTLEESTLAPELIVALKDWKAGTDHAPLLIGGLALSYHVKPRLQHQSSGVQRREHGFS